MSGFQELQFLLLKSGAIFCLFLAVFVGVARNYERNRRISLIALQLWTSILLFSDSIAYAYEGVSGEVAYYAVRISNFTVYLATLVVILGYLAYLATWINKNDKKKRSFIICKIVVFLVIVGIVMVIIAWFEGWYYTIDRYNYYHRGNYNYVSYIVPVLCMALILILTIINYKGIDKRVRRSLLFYEIGPIIAGTIQVHVYGASFINLTVGISVIILFSMAVLEQNRALEKASTTEPRSGLLNSYGYFRWIGKIKRKEHLSEYNAYYFELKDYSLFNRKYGSDIVTLMQRQYHKILFESIEANEIIANLGGDYYVALIKKDHTGKFLQMMNGVEVELQHNGRVLREVFATIVGGYSIENDDVEAEDLMANTAIAVGMARHIGGKEAVFIDDSLKERIMEKREIEKRIPIAMEKGEFVPFYQPKVSAKQKELNGAEALVRWKQGANLIPPGKFIPILEENDGICKMDFYMLDKVCEDLEGWIKEGLNPPRISVNFSRKNLHNQNLAKDITTIIDMHNVPHNLIEIEITETLDEHPMEVMSKLVDELHDRNITVAIDDFGTGSSSMNLLRAVNFDMIKIDRSFVYRDNDRDHKILTRIVTIANDIEIGIIAEGVETYEQLKKLTELGCDNIQGFLFDKPLPKEEFKKRIMDVSY